MEVELTMKMGLELSHIAHINKTPDYKLKLYQAALYYIELGYYLVPLVKGAKRLPRQQYNVNYGHASRNKKVIDKWFEPEKGKFAGWNIGIACGREGGVFALDIDRHGDKNGFKTIERLEKKFEPLPLGPIQTTPGGGEHRLFQWQENAACTTEKIGSGIDTRGGESKNCKGHIVVWPSDIDGKTYEWKDGGALPYTPSWVMERMGAVWKPKSYGRGNENVGEEDTEETIPLPQIERMLSHISINDLDYNDWVRVGMAIKSQHPGKEGLKVWGVWSKEGERYKKGECTVRWRGFSDFGSVRAGTLFYFAKEGGWTPDPIEKDVHGNKYDELVAKMNQEYAIVSIGGKIRILKEKEPADKLGMRYDLLDKESFRTLLQNSKVWATSGGKTKAVQVSDIWLGHEHRRTYPGGLGLFPNNNPPHGYYNTWSGFSVESREGDCSLFLDHIKTIICDDNKDHYEWLMDWLADLVQDPANVKGCAIIMKGGEGAGKGIFAETIGELFGPHYRHLIDTSHLTSNFNAHLLDSIVVFADEITWGGNKKSAGKLKGMVTERNLVGERKGVDAIQYKNMIHMIMASNDEWIIQAGIDSRRWFILDVSEKRKKDIPYFKAIIDELNNGGQEALLYTLLNRKITHNLRRAPKTEALQAQRILNLQQDSVLGWWCQRLIKEELNIPHEGNYEESVGDNWPQAVDKIALYEDFQAWQTGKGFFSTPIFIFQKKIIGIGIISSKIRLTDDKRKPIYRILPLEEAKEFIIEKYGDIL